MQIHGKFITDDAGRILNLRGCNLGGSTKIPAGGGALSADNLPHTAAGSAAPPYGADYAVCAYPPEKAVSFVGKPFPEEEADERFAELASWGFAFNRLVVPWEAIEHEAPGVYDEAYLAYLRKILLAAEKHGISVMIDPHQDVWGRAAGGDGAPAWTLELLGIEVSRLQDAGAVLPGAPLECIVPPDKRPLMTWPAGYNRYAAATMFTLFFGGNIFAPKCFSTGETMQDFLQGRYIEAYAHCRRRLKNCKAIVGWGTMNEPHPGFIGYKNLASLENNMVANGPMPSPLQAFAAASGHTVEVPIYSTGIFGVKKKGDAVFNAGRVSVFRSGFQCPWKTAGVWTDDGGEPRLLKPDYFSCVNGKPASFAEDFLKPFINKFSSRLGEADENAVFFVEGVPAGLGTGDDVTSVASSTDAETAKKTSPRFINAFHWYDGPTMFIKQFRPWFNYNLKNGKIVLGRKAVKALYLEQISSHIADSMPSIVGEFGLPFDIYKGRAFKTGDYAVHEEALSMYYDAFDALLLGCCIWAYSADNTFRWGDLWNNEEFSFVTRDYAGRTEEIAACPLKPRAQGGWLRPYPAATAGTPLEFTWNRKTKKMFFRYKASPAISAPTEIFIPANLHKELKVTVTPACADRPELETEYDAEKFRLKIFGGTYDGEVAVRAEEK